MSPDPGLGAGAPGARGAWPARRPAAPRGAPARGPRGPRGGQGRPPPARGARGARGGVLRPRAPGTSAPNALQERLGATSLGCDFPRRPAGAGNSARPTPRDPAEVHGQVPRPNSPWRARRRPASAGLSSGEVPPGPRIMRCVQHPKEFRAPRGARTAPWGPSGPSDTLLLLLPAEAPGGAPHPMV